jgi:hypothetical protein
MTNGMPSRLHQRIAYASPFDRASILALVTVGTRLARGTFRLSKFSSQNPERSRPARASCAARARIAVVVMSDSGRECQR